MPSALCCVLYLVCVSTVTASRALQRMSRDRSMSHAQEGSMEFAASSSAEPDRPEVVARDDGAERSVPPIYREERDMGRSRGRKQRKEEETDK